MAYLGVHMTLHPSDSPRARFWYKFGFVACAVLAIVLVAVQSYRTNRSQQDSSNQIAGLRSDVQAAKTESQTARTETQQIRVEFEIESARREQAEKDLLIATRGIESNTRKQNTQLVGMSAQEQQRSDAFKQMMLRISLQQLADKISTLEFTEDEWRKADSEARAKAGPRGRYDPDYQQQHHNLNLLYDRELHPTILAAKDLYDQIRESIPRAKIEEIGDGSNFGSAASGAQEFDIASLRGIILALTSAYTKASAILLSPEE